MIYNIKLLAKKTIAISGNTVWEEILKSYLINNADTTKNNSNSCTNDAIMAIRKTRRVIQFNYSEFICKDL